MALDTSTARSDIAKIYIAAFNRAPDAGGLDFWTGAYLGGTSLSKIAEGFASSQEFTNKLTPNAVTNSEYVAKIYLNVFGRAVDTAGSSFWTAALDSGKVTKAGLLNELVAAAGANGSNDGQMLANKATVGIAYATSSVGSSMTQEAAIASVTADSATVTTALAAIAAVANTVTLTSGNDNLAGYVFDAPQTYTPGGTDRINSLQDNDKLTGTGTADALNVTIGKNADTGDINIMPTITGVESINVAFDTTGYDVDMQDSTGTTAINITRMEDSATNKILNMKEVVANFSVAASTAPVTSVVFDFTDAAVSGTSDTTAITLKDVNTAGLTVNGSANQGVENITLTSSTAANTVTALTTTDLKTLTINGATNLTLGVTNTTKNQAFTKVDASTLTGNLKYTVAAGTFGANTPGTSGVDVAFGITSGIGTDTINISDQVGTNDSIDAGDGTDTLAMSGATGNIDFFATNDTAQVSNVEKATMTLAATATGAGSTLTANMTQMSGDQTITVRNASTEDDTAVFVITNATTAEATGITIQHGATGSNALADATVDLDVADSGVTAAGITITDASNTDVRFNFTLTADSDGTALNATNNVTSLTITDSDTEDNTISITEYAAMTGTLTLAGGTSGKYMNLDATANGYTKNPTGATGDATVTAQGLGDDAANSDDTAVSSVFLSDNYAGTTELLVATTITAASYAGDVILRAGTANQSITTNSGSDTIIFGARTGITTTTAGLTTSDTVKAGTGTDTLILDGTSAVNIGASEWTNVSGVDVIRLGNLPGASYAISLTDALVDQTDVGDRITVVNNDGLNNSLEIAATIDARAINNYNNYFTFVGANGNKVTPARQTIILDDATSNSSNYINGGDRDNYTTYTTSAASNTAYATSTGVNTDSNDNLLKIVDTATVTIGDLTNTKNFKNLNFTSEAAIAQTLTLTLDDTTVDQLVDASHTSNTTDANGAETLVITATDNATVAGAHAKLNISAGTLTGKSNLNVTGSGGDDTIVTGGGADVIVGGAGADTITSGAGADTITSGAGADTITVGAGVDTIIWTATTATLIATEVGGTVGSGNTGDSISSWTTGADKLHFAAALVTNVLGTEVDTLKEIAKAGTVANTDRFVQVTNTAVGDVVDTFAGAVTVLNGLTTSAVAIGDSFIVAMDNDTNTYLYLVEQVSAADTIAAQDVTYIGVINNGTDVANGDFVSF